MGLRAGFWRRFAAFMVDAVLVGILAAFLGSRFIIEPAIRVGLFEAFPIDSETAAMVFFLRVLYWSGRAI